MIPEIDKDPERYSENELIVFNRWGDVIYQADSYQNDWDGTHYKNSQPLPAGTYYYIIRFEIGEGEIRNGMVTIVR